ncbi:MAG: nucleoside triphosphatase NudI [Candidatus Taylorbacteria bacterium]|nr:nucleoside triphosphatase NudI [Candidatus Taylorbacteria bacterium]
MKTRVIVSAIIENDKGEILFGRQKPGRGVYLDKWHIPGGGVEENERIEEALRREIKEETGLQVKDIEPITFSDDVTNRLKDEKTEEIHMVFLDFRCKAVGSKTSAADDIENLRWVAKTEIKDLELPPPSQKLFRKLGWIK